MEEDQNSVDYEVTPQDQESNIVDENMQVEASAEASQAKEEDAQERNWRELRRKAEEAEQKSKMQEEMIKNLLEMQKSQMQPQQQQQPQEIDEFADIDPEDFPTYGKTEKLVEKRARDIARREYQRLKEEDERNRYHERLKSEYQDYDSVVTPEAIAFFDKNHPKLARTIAKNTDPYEIGLQTYHYLKLMNVDGEKANQRHSKEVKKKIEENEKSIQSPQAYDKRPMAQAFSLANMDKEEKKRIYEEMMGYAGQASYGY